VSVRATTAVWEWSEAPNKTVLVVALVLADHADNDGRVWMAIENVATQARVARSTAYESIHVLERLAEIVLEHRGGNGPGDTSTYRLTLVDNLPIRVRGPDPYKGPKRVRKGSGLSDTKLRTVDTYKGDAREKPFAVDWDDAPPMPDPKELVNRIADVRSRIGRADRKPPA
jgi:hypothetical protein